MKPNFGRLREQAKREGVLYRATLERQREGVSKYGYKRKGEKA